MVTRVEAREDIFAPRAVNICYRADQSLILESPIRLGTYPQHICKYLERWAAEAPNRTFLAERDRNGEWLHLGYEDAWRRVQSLGQALLTRGLSKETPIAILTGNSIEHALLTFAGMLARIPVAPISPAYGVHPEGSRRLAEICRILKPALVFVQSPAVLERVRQLNELADVEWISVEPVPGTTSFSELESVERGREIDEAFEQSNDLDIAKILFTSGSTGSPKGVPQTQRMLCSAIHGASLLSLTKSPPVIVDWMPWHHTMGGNNTLHGILRNGGTLYVDDGRPMPELFERTVRNLKDIAVTSAQNVPAGLQMLVAAMEEDDDLRENFFKRCERMSYAGAALGLQTWQRLQELSVMTTGRPIPLTSGYGTTETAPGICTTHWACEGRGEIGLPIPGVQVKLVPIGDRYEIRARGPNVMPGYLGQVDGNGQVFDDEGFYRVGDAVRFFNPLDPREGLCFAGRLSENFKLSNGSWVIVEELRSAIKAAVPGINEVVIAGHDRDDVRLLIWVGDALRANVGPAGLDETQPEEDLVTRVAADLRYYNDQTHGSTRRVAAFAILTREPSLGAGEVTDKGSVNQRAVLATYANLVEDLYSASPSELITLL